MSIKDLQTIVQTLGALKIQKKLLEEQIDKLKLDLQVGCVEHSDELLKETDCRECKGTGCTTCQYVGKRYIYEIPVDESDDFQCTVYEVTSKTFQHDLAKKLIDSDILRKLYKTNTYGKVDVRMTNTCKNRLSNG